MKSVQRITIALAFGLIGFSNLPATAQAWQWAHILRAGSSATINTQALAGTSTDQVYTAIQFDDSVQLGGRTYPRGSAVAHLATNGSLRTVPVWGATTLIQDIKVDPADNLYVAGYFSDTISFGATQRTALSASAYFLAKLDSSGTLLWLQQAAQTDTVRRNVLLALDAAQNATLYGTFRTSVAFGDSIATTSAGQTEFFLVHFAANGDVSWLRHSRTPAGTPRLTLTALAAAPNGTLYAAASGTVGYGDSTQVGWGDSTLVTIYLMPNAWLQLTPQGRLQRQILVGGDAISTSIAVDPAGTPFVLFRGYSDLVQWGAEIYFHSGPPIWGSHILIVGRVNSNGLLDWTQYAGTSELEPRTPFVALAKPGGTRILIGGGFGDNGDALECPPFIIHCSPDYQNDGFLLELDGLTGTAVSLQSIGTGWGNCAITALGASMSNRLYMGGNFNADMQLGPFACNSTTYREEGFVAKLIWQYNQAVGTVFTDTNRNAVRDPGEGGHSNIIVASSAGTYYSTDSVGTFVHLLDSGTYQLSIPNAPRYYTAVPAGPTTVSFTSYGAISSGHDFALQPTPNQQDLQVALTSVNRARPGFAVRYRLTAHNVGTTVSAAPVLHFTYDSLLTFVSASPTATPSGSTLQWQLGPLQPDETRQVDVVFQLPATTPLGSLLSATARLDPLAGDLTPADNTEMASLAVTGSYDPNDIAVNFATLTLAEVRGASKALDYTVRFENMGTDTAFTVTLSDALPAALLNLSTLQMVASSHPSTWRLGAGGVLTISFPNINLPDHTTNPLGSMGFVRFRVVPNTTLAPGDVIPNQAAIFFDFNAPVATNTAVTTVLNPTGLAPDASTLTGSVWPNPAATVLHVVVARPAGAAVVLTLTDALGRTVRTATLSASVGATAETTLDVRGLAPGLYVVRAEAGGRRWSQRVVVRP